MAQHKPDGLLLPILTRLLVHVKRVDLERKLYPE